ncbi:hypothetical protein CWE05_01560 [Bifidobacterium longum]|nr:hypothetical protein CWE05_01560 [Bifidobacterium longum]
MRCSAPRRARNTAHDDADTRHNRVQNLGRRRPLTMMFVTKTAEQGALYGYRTGHSERGTTGELQHRRISR